jgi:hypothetical protein
MGMVRHGEGAGQARGMGSCGEMQLVARALGSPLFFLESGTRIGSAVVDTVARWGWQWDLLKWEWWLWDWPFGYMSSNESHLLLIDFQMSTSTDIERISSAPLHENEKEEDSEREEDHFGTSTTHSQTIDKGKNSFVHDYSIVVKGVKGESRLKCNFCG